MFLRTFVCNFTKSGLWYFSLNSSKFLFQLVFSTSLSTHCVKCPNTDQKKLRIWTFSTQWFPFISTFGVFSELYLDIFHVAGSFFKIKNQFISYQKNKTNPTMLCWKPVISNATTLNRSTGLFSLCR